MDRTVMRSESDATWPTTDVFGEGDLPADGDWQRVVPTGGQGASTLGLQRAQQAGLKVSPWFCLTVEKVEELFSLADVSGGRRGFFNLSEKECVAKGEQLQQKQLLPAVKRQLQSYLESWDGPGEASLWVRPSFRASPQVEALLEPMIAPFVVPKGNVDELWGALRQIVAALFSSVTQQTLRAAPEVGFPPQKIGLALLVQQIETPRSSGVFVTRDPKSSDFFRKRRSLSCFGSRDRLQHPHFSPLITEFDVSQGTRLQECSDPTERLSLSPEEAIELGLAAEQLEKKSVFAQRLQWSISLAGDELQVVDCRDILELPTLAVQDELLLFNRSEKLVLLESLKDIEKPLKPFVLDHLCHVTEAALHAEMRSLWGRAAERSLGLSRLLAGVQGRAFMNTSAWQGWCRSLAAVGWRRGVMALRRFCDQLSLMWRVGRIERELQSRLRARTNTTRMGETVESVLEKHTQLLQWWVNCEPLMRRCDEVIDLSFGWLESLANRVGLEQGVQTIVKQSAKVGKQGLPSLIPLLAVMDLAQKLQSGEVPGSGALKGVGSRKAWAKICDEDQEDLQKLRESLVRIADDYGYWSLHPELIEVAGWQEDPSQIVALLQDQLNRLEGPTWSSPRSSDEALESTESVLQRLSRVQRWGIVLVSRVAAWALRQSDRLRVSRQRAHSLMRVELAAVGQRLKHLGVLHSADDLHFLQLQELRDLVTSRWNGGGLQELLRMRRQGYQDLCDRRESLGPTYLLRGPLCLLGQRRDLLEFWRDAAEEASELKEPSSSLNGNAEVPGVVEGTAWPIRNVSDLRHCNGKLVVLEEPVDHWLPHLVKAEALLVASKSRHSHVVAAARELCLPTVTGFGSELLQIKRGEELRLDATTGHLLRKEHVNGSGAKRAGVESEETKNFSQTPEKVLPGDDPLSLSEPEVGAVESAKEPATKGKGVCGPSA